jgi:hypothetical protein
VTQYQTIRWTGVLVADLQLHDSRPYEQTRVQEITSDLLTF